MTQLRENFVVDTKSNRVGVFLRIKDYNKLLEELEDIRAYDKAKAKKENPIPLRDAIQQRRKR